MAMQLEPSAEGLREYTSLALLIDELNKHASTQGYAVTKKRTKVFKRGVLMKAWIHCDRGGKAQEKGHGHRRTASRRNECPFFCIAKLDNNIEDEQELGN